MSSTLSPGPALPADLSKKKSKRRRDEDVDIKISSGVDYSVIHTAPVEDARFERQKKARQASKEQQSAPAAQNVLFGAPGAASATVDALSRMMLGKDARTIADKINDPHRPTWEQYKKENKDKLDLGGGEKQMMEYRKKLDEEREKALRKRSQSKKDSKRSSSDTEDSDSDRKKSSKKKTKRKKSKDRKKRKKHRRGSDGSDDSDSSQDDRKSSRKKSKKKSKEKKDKSKSKDDSSPVRLSSFFAEGSSSESER